MIRKKALNQVMNMGGLVSEMISVFYNEFFKEKEYEWWYKVQPGDTVVDLGACVGMFSALACDGGASKVYMVEGNRHLLKCAIDNVSEFMMNEPDPIVFPINAIIGSADGVYKTIHDETTNEDIDKISFKQLVERYDIDYIDYLKADIEGAEYDVFTEENLDYMLNNVKHMVIEVHTQATPGGLKDFFHFRDNFLNHFVDSPRHEVRTRSQFGEVDGLFMWQDHLLKNAKPSHSYWLLYITRKDNEEE
jgi:FkbM family methyltransferase